MNIELLDQGLIVEFFLMIWNIIFGFLILTGFANLFKYFFKNLFGKL